MSTFMNGEDEASEFGGVPGLLNNAKARYTGPLDGGRPQGPTVIEKLWMTHTTDSTDPAAVETLEGIGEDHTLTGWD